MNVFLLIVAIINIFLLIFADKLIAFFAVEALVFFLLSLVSAFRISGIIEYAHILKDDKSYLNGQNTSDKTRIESLIYSLALGRKDKIISKTSIKQKQIYTIIFAVLLFVILNVLYRSPAFLTAIVFLITFYCYCLANASTVNIVVKKAKENPDTAVTSLISSDICTEEEEKEYKRNLIISAISIPLALLLFVGINFESRYFTKKVSDGYYISSYRPGISELIKKKEITIPEYINDKKIVGIGQKAFSNDASILSVSMPDSVRTIEASAFQNCSNLETVQLSNSLEAIKSKAFKDCFDLKEITLPDSLTILEGESFMNCKSLKSITIPKGVTEIRGNTFDSCYSLSEVILHDEIIDIHAYAFQYCRSLTEIDLPSKITEIHTYTFAYCSRLKTINIPDGVTRIASHAFFDCDNLHQVILPLTLNEIGSSAFRSCSSLKEIALPYSVTISENAFSESPTKISRNPFPNKVSEQINEDFRNDKYDEIYIVYLKSKGTDEPLSVQNNGVLSVSYSKDIKDSLSDDLDIFTMNDRKEFADYLKKAKDKGFTQVDFYFYSDAANEYLKEKTLISASADINEVIKSFEEEQK